MTRRVRAFLFLLVVASACGAPPVEETSVSAQTKLASVPEARVSPLTPAEEPELQRAIERARAAVKGIDPDDDPRHYVKAFEAALRPQVAEITGQSIPELPVDERPSALPMYETLARLIEFRSTAAIYLGDRKKGEERSEVVSLFDTAQCTAVVIATNAIATALHCVDEERPQYVRVGATSTSGKQVKIDPTRFIPVEKLHGLPLDMAILVTDGPIPDVSPDDLPVFAPPDLIDKAKEWHIVGFGGLEVQLTAAGPVVRKSGTKRLGIVPSLDSSCAGKNVAADYKCRPGHEIVAGAWPMMDRSTCPGEGVKPGQTGACEGDSGAPVYAEMNGRLYLAGIVRRLEDPLKCGCSSATNVYVRFDTQLDYIRKIPGIQFHAGAFSALGGS